jgi:hypothetical protein
VPQAAKDGHNEKSRNKHKLPSATFPNRPEQLLVDDERTLFRNPTIKSGFIHDYVQDTFLERKGKISQYRRALFTLAPQL